MDFKATEMTTSKKQPVGKISGLLQLPAKRIDLIAKLSTVKLQSTAEKCRVC